MAVEVYDKKIIACGDIIEVYEYENNVVSGFTNSKSKGKGRSCVADEEEQVNNRELVLHRARRDLRRLINCNIDMYGVPGKFVTLTFSEDITDIKKANYEFKKFIQRLGDYTEKDLKYAAVPEIQKERLEKSGQAVWHYHVIFFNLPFIQQKKLSGIWKNGFVFINRIDRVDNVGAYICKYMTKDNKELKGQKCYFTSRNLYKPIVIKEKNRVDNLAVALPVSALTYESTYENEHNKTLYKQYNMKKVKNEEVI